jgi:chromosomal replication initiation ATPase DnaA
MMRDWDDYAAAARRRISERTLRSVAAATAAEFGIDEADLLSDCRRRRFVWPRQAAYLAATQLGASLNRAADVLGRDHSTVHVGARTAAQRCSANPEYAQKVDAVLARLSGSQEAA